MHQGQMVQAFSTSPIDVPIPAQWQRVGKAAWTRSAPWCVWRGPTVDVSQAVAQIKAFDLELGTDASTDEHEALLTAAREELSRSCATVAALRDVRQLVAAEAAAAKATHAAAVAVVASSAELHRANEELRCERGATVCE